MPVPTSELNHWRELFEYAPISLWEEDYSGIHKFFAELRSRGVKDLARHLADHPEDVHLCISRITILQVNRKTLELFGATSQQDLIANLDKIFRDRMDVHFASELVDMWNGATSYEREGINYSIQGDPIDIQLWWRVLPGHEQDLSRVLVSISDITARKRAETYLRYLGTHDVLTGLYNRAFFVEQMDRLEKEGPFPVGILIGDLNDLKLVNDTYGHEAGDELLRRIAEVFRSAFTETDIVARMGGDEFAILLPGFSPSAGEKVLSRIRKLISLNNTYYQGPDLLISLGIAVGTRGQSLIEVQRLADDRMYIEKRDYHRLSGR